MDPVTPTLQVVSVQSSCNNYVYYNASIIIKIIIKCQQCLCSTHPEVGDPYVPLDPPLVQYALSPGFGYTYQANPACYVTTRVPMCSNIFVQFLLILCTRGHEELPDFATTEDTARHFDDLCKYVPGRHS